MHVPYEPFELLRNELHQHDPLMLLHTNKFREFSKYILPIIHIAMIAAPKL